MIHPPVQSEASSQRRVLLPKEVTLPTGLWPAETDCVHQLSGTAMGTRWCVQYVGPPLHDTAIVYKQAESVFDRIVQQMSHWEPNSHLSRFNRASPGTWHAIPHEFFHVLEKAIHVSRLTDGAYDVTIGRWIHAEGFGAESADFGPFEEVELLRGDSGCDNNKPGGWKRLRLDSQTKSIFQPGGLALNLSSIAKGYAVDLVSECLMSIGLHHHLIELGGELRGEGVKPNGQPWWCQVENTTNSESLPQTIVALNRLSVATSGDSVHYRVKQDGSRISHLLDPRSSQAASAEVVAVSVFLPSCMEADAWATALYILGAEEGIRSANRHRIPVLYTVRHGESFAQFASESLESLASD